jgi:hypothetical protein
MKENIANIDALKVYLKSEFDNLLSNPESFGLDEETSRDLKKMFASGKAGELKGELETRVLWSLFKGHFGNSQQGKAFLGTMPDEVSVAQFLKQDLAEDHVKIVSKKALRVLLSKPDLEEYHLEPSMVEWIKGLTPEKRASLLEAAALELDLEDKSIWDEIGDAFGKFFHDLWVKLEPIFSKIAGKVLDLAIARGEKFLNQKLALEGDDMFDFAMNRDHGQSVYSKMPKLEAVMPVVAEESKEEESKEDEAAVKMVDLDQTVHQIKADDAQDNSADDQVAQLAVQMAAVVLLPEAVVSAQDSVDAGFAQPVQDAPGDIVPVVEGPKEPEMTFVAVVEEIHMHHGAHHDEQQLMGAETQVNMDADFVG